MAVPNFPSSPANGDTVTENGITYTFNSNGGGTNIGFWEASGEAINLQSVTDNGNVTDTRAGINATGTTAPIDSLCLPYIDTANEERGIAWQRGAIDSARIVVHCEDTGFSRAASLRFKTMTANGAAADRFIIEDAGDVSIVDGNLVVANGHGIDFSATPSTGTSELFDDYEEGNWTPNLVGAVTAGTITTSSTVARYTKVGNQVTCWAAFGISAASGAVGSLSITGLPFSYPANTFITGSVRWNAIAFNGSNSASPNDVSVLQGSGSSANFVQIAYSSDGSSVSTTVLDSGQITTATFIQFCITYTV